MADNSDQNRQIKLKASRKLSQLINLISAKDFTGSVQVTIYSTKGKATKIRSTVEEIDHPE